MIPTAEEFIVIYNSTEQKDSLIVAFAKLHREAILKAVIENIKVKDLNEDNMLSVDEDGSHYEYYVVDKDSILNAYPENLIV